MSARFLMIALDGADGNLLDRWSADGTLPNLAALRARGGATRLSAPEGVTDDAIWASFQYSAGMGEHGRIHWLQRLDSGRLGMAYLNDSGRETFWENLSKQGMRAAVFDVPKCGLPRPINGIHLVDWLVHGRYFKEPKSYPEPLAGTVVERFGPAPPSRCDYEGPPLSDAELNEVTANLRASVAMKRAAGLHYLASEQWDLFVVGFKEAHCAGHNLWDLVDPRHPDYDAARVASLGDPYRLIMIDLDAAVGELVAEIGPAAPVVVFSTSDMEPNATLAHLMPEIVNRVNRRLGEGPIIRNFRRVMRRLFSTQPGSPPCELMPYNENCTALRVNPRQGVFESQPNDDRRKTRMLDRIESILRELVDGDTGKAVVAAIDRQSATYGGPRIASLPDLLVRYEAGTSPRSVISPLLGRIEAERPALRPGNHAAGGFLIYAGVSPAAVKGVEDLGRVAARVLQGNNEVRA